MILEEFDSDKNAVINPHVMVEDISDMPRTAISCFSAGVFRRMIKVLQAKPLQAGAHTLTGNFYKAEHQGEQLLLFNAPMGAPVCVAVLEQVFAMGTETIILFGSCGVLQEDIKENSLIIPVSAIRDEGTSYHYAPASDEIKVNPEYREKFEHILQELELTYTKGKVWTMDAFFRETVSKLGRRREQGCICVDMECSAVSALARFREKEVFQFFYAADALTEDGWNERSLNYVKEKAVIDKIITAAAELAVHMKKIKR